MRALLSLGLDLLAGIGFIGRTAYAIALEHPFPVAVGLILWTVWAWHRLACALEHPDDQVTVSRTSTRIIWTNPPTLPAAKGLKDRRVHRSARSIVHPDKGAA